MSTSVRCDGRHWLRLTGNGLVTLVVGLCLCTDVEAQAATPGVAGSVDAAGITASAPTSSTGLQVLSLERCIELAQQNYPKVAEARARLAIAEAQASESRIAPYSEFSSTAGIAAAPTVRGTSWFSPDTDVAIKGDMGLAWQVGVSGNVPLWTFGKIDGLQRAADAQLGVKRHEVRQSRDDVAMSVRRAYYGVLFTRDTATLLDEVQKHVSKSLDKLKQQVDDGDADEIDLLKLKMYDAEMRARRSELDRQRGIALSGLKFLVGSREPFEVADVPLPRPRHRLAPLSYYLTVARVHRPEVNMARAGILARQAQLEVERAKYFPDIGAILNFSWSQAPEVTDQRNPFVRDPGNFLLFGAGIGMKWKLDFFAQSTRVSQAEARLQEVQATERFALGGIATEVEKAYLEAVDAERQLNAYAEAAGYARRWLVIVQQGIDIGSYDENELVGPAKEYALKRFSEMNATFEYNVALARLAQVTGFAPVADDLVTSEPTNDD
jgi:outer membrane protein TolC